MASPKLEVFFLYHDDDLTPYEGLAPEFTTYVDHLGADVTPQPTISEIGGGAYGFLPTFPVDLNKGVVYVVEAGDGATPAYVGKYMRPEDYYTDNIPTIQTLVETLKKIEVNRWKIWTTGPNQYKLIYYDDDGTTPIYTFNLKDQNGTGTVESPFERVPV